MKTPILCFCLAFGLANFGFAQNEKLIAPYWINKNFQPSPKVDFKNHLFLNPLDTLIQDSLEVHFPEMFPLNRELNLLAPNSLLQHALSLPFVELPPAQSRMPIIPFDESVNYTILKKEY
ncbi:hypothetical protein [Algoriphagus litoralis]|uniref:hypothetical protein n=1 Tax=Algoriphagus litoralis TaxID=2202829 RepID=UPI000DBA1D93|nr:hypothetical protein [Algoriphagus litoralis]